MKNYYCNYVSIHTSPLFHFIVSVINSVSLWVVQKWIFIKNLNSGQLLVVFLLSYLFLSYSNTACFYFLSNLPLYEFFKHKLMKIYFSKADLNSSKHNWMCTIPKVFFLHCIYWGGCIAVSPANNIIFTSMTQENYTLLKRTLPKHTANPLKIQHQLK